MYTVCPVTFIFQVTHHRHMVQAITWSNHGCFVVTVGVWSGFHPFQSRQQCTAWSSLKHSLTCWCWCLSQLLYVLRWKLLWSEGLFKQKRTHQSCTWQLSVLCSQRYTFLDISCSTTAGHLPLSVLELCHAETITCASQLEAHLLIALVELFLENLHIIEQPICQVADRDSSSSEADTDLLPAFTDSMRIILYQVGDCCGHCTKHALSVHRVSCKKSLSAVCWCHSHSQNYICSATDMCYANSGMDAIEDPQLW
jgi:hypothetical protein